MTGEENYQKEMTEFASLVAHQLKSPVGAAGTLVKTLLGEYAGSLTAKQKDLLLRIDKRLTEAVDTSKRMITIANPAEMIGSSDTVTDLSLMLRECHVRYEEEAAIKGITFEVKINREPAYINASESALTEILNSLVSNSLKYTPENGRIVLDLKSSKVEEGVVILNISDSGIGIPEKNLDKIFQPFYRSATSQGSNLPGAGLGLAFVKTIVDVLGGEISAGRSEMGGANFTLKLKLDKSEISVKNNEAIRRMKVVIIGGVAAGPKVASKIVRLAPHTEVTIIDREDILSYSGCGLPYYVSGVVKKKSALLSTAVKEVRDPVFFQNVKHILIMNKTEVLKIDRKNKKIKIKNLQKNHESWIDYDKLVLATGSYPLKPEIEGVNLKNIFTLHGVHDAEGIKAFLSGKKARDVVIVGGGLIGIEMTEALVKKGCRVTIIEKKQQIFSFLDEEIAKLLQQYLESNGVKIILASKPDKFLGSNGKVRAVASSGVTIPADMVILAVGVAPAVKLASEAGLELGVTGAIKVNSRMETSDSEIFAAGDCSECYDAVTGKPCYIPLGSTANKEGRIAAVNICGRDEHFSGVNGSVSCKIFEYHISKTGLNEKEAIDNGFKIVTTLTSGPDREHFMPNVKRIMMKLIVDKSSRRLLGAQAIGDSKCFNKIDIISTAMMGRLTIDDIANLDLCYSPAFSLSMDNVIIAANVAKNKLDSIFEGITAKKVYEKIKKKDKFVLLDVRSHKEYESIRIPGSTLIPLGVLRGRIYELPKDMEIITFCSISLRGYEAALILKSSGFENVKVMDGGILMWPYEITEGLN